MTFESLHDLVDELSDKEGSDWFPSEEKDRLLNMAQNRYVEKMYKILEQDEQARAQMNPITFKAPVFTSTSTINLSTISNFRYVVSLSIKINYTDPFGVVTEIERAVQARALSKVVKNKNNSFTKGTVSFPIYQEYNNTSHILEIISGNVVPNTATVYYLANPTQIDGTNNPTGVVDFADNVCENIAMMCVESMMAIIESQRFQTERVEENEKFTNN